MQLLDATLAFALTMAALATVVTIIMEACLRIARMRKKNFIEVMKLLDKELTKSALNIDEQERWDFFLRVIENPAEAAIERLAPELEELNHEERLAFFGRDKTAGKGKFIRTLGFLGQIFGDRKRTSLYEKVSLEYMLRCLAESQSVRKASKEASRTIKAELNRIARKYEEFSSAVSASFKQYARLWSIGIGIGLAIVANIDGLRIFEAYRTDPKLAAAVIEKHETFLKNHQEALKNLNALEEEVAELEKKIDNAKKEYEAKEASYTKEVKETAAKQIEELELALNKKKTTLDEQIAVKNVQLKAQQAQQQLTDLIAIGVPLGWSLYPNCPYEDDKDEWATSSPRCKEIPDKWKERIFIKSPRLYARVLNTAGNDLAGFLTWLFIVTITGILIGLGAPFWFDVAKRLSQIRKGLQNPSASAEYRFSGNDANGDPKRREEIVENVLSDATAEAAVSAVGELGTFLGPKALRL